jgi:hypothetical protein
MNIIRIALISLLSASALAQCPITITKLDRGYMKVTVVNDTAKDIAGVRFGVAFYNPLWELSPDPAQYVIGNVLKARDTNTFEMNPRKWPDDQTYPYVVLKVLKIHYRDGSDWANDGSCKFVIDPYMKERLPADAAKLEGR